MGLASIKLIKYTSEYNFDPDQRKGWALLVRASESVGMDREVFVYHRMSQKDAYTGDVFEAVASINQYYEVPKNTPKIVNENELIPYYRRNQMEVFARSPEELNEIWEYVKIDVGRLVADLNSTNVFDAITEVDIVDDGNLVETDIGYNGSTLELDWKPAGNWDGTNIVQPNIETRGWLPISVFENGMADATEAVPTNARWFYNRAAHPTFDSVYKSIKQPYKSNFLELNSQEVLYGGSGTYELTADTIFWLENKNHALEEIQENPWPDDFIDGLVPSYTPTLRLIMPL